MAFQDDLKFLRSKFADAFIANVVEEDVKNFTEAFLITLLSEFEKQRLGLTTQIDNYKKQIDHFNLEIKNFEHKIEETNKKIKEIEVNSSFFSSLGGITNATLSLFLAKAAQLKEEEKRFKEEQLIKQKAIEEFEAKQAAELAAKKAEEERLAAELAAKQAEEERVAAEKNEQQEPNKVAKKRNKKSKESV